jgi:hypothetical protein
MFVLFFDRIIIMFVVRTLLFYTISIQKIIRSALKNKKKKVIFFIYKNMSNWLRKVAPKSENIYMDLKSMIN